MTIRKARALLAAAVLLALAFSLAAPVALAQDYSFSVPESRVDLYVNRDGTVDIAYDLTFAPDPGSHDIDFVDIGMPNDTYDLSQIRASVGGVPLTDISTSPYVKPGVAVGLGGQTIPAGQTGTLHLEATVRDLLYQDSKDPEYASIEFSPTWFDSNYVHGPTRLEVNLHLPPGMTPEEPRYHDRPFTSAAFEDDRVVYTWIDEEASASSKFVVGASFPKRVLDEGVVQKPPAFNLNFGALCSSPVCWIGLFFVGWVLMALLGQRAQKRRKMAYLPPSVAVEGTGVKRGLTAVEAAILLEAPLNKVLTMILFSLVKKGLVTVESEKPLKVKRVPAAASRAAAKAVPPAEQASPEAEAGPSPQAAAGTGPQAAAGTGPRASARTDAGLWEYEQRFLEAIEPGGALNEKELRTLIVDLIGDVNKKVAAFNRKETKAYYQDIAARAWKQVEAADTPQVLGERWGDGLEWTMLDDDWDDRTRRVFRDRPVVVPIWWQGYRPWSTTAGGSTAGPSAPSPSGGGGGVPVTLPTLPGADFANTVVGGVESAANTVVGSLSTFTGGVASKTNPPPKPAASSSSRSGGSGGGHSCACACACAGCACACAGGGR